MIDLNPLLHNIRTRFPGIRSRRGKYARYTLGSSQPNPYGCADAANILYSIGEFPAETEEHAEAVRTQYNLKEQK